MTNTIVDIIDCGGSYNINYDKANKLIDFIYKISDIRDYKVYTRINKYSFDYFSSKVCVDLIDPNTKDPKEMIGGYTFDIRRSLPCIVELFCGIKPNIIFVNLQFAKLLIHEFRHVKQLQWNDFQDSDLMYYGHIDNSTARSMDIIKASPWEKDARKFTSKMVKKHRKELKSLSEGLFIFEGEK